MPRRKQPGAPTKRAKPQGFRAVHVLVPEQAHWQARKAALESHMPFKVFMAHLLSHAQAILPIPVPDELNHATPEDAPNLETATTAMMQDPAPAPSPAPATTESVLSRQPGDDKESDDPHSTDEFHLFR